ncbi:hypothetical protein ACWT_0697 [Actinoplanes sp. SE50]|uniref:hypothetical protein n=1 Tax=unclassified Actinoplanes TaxID=2626549 RepID=UPI00023ED53F|nr:MULTISPECIES: hypothetical protein [unclassified Actinoplanes]AEV81711.1 hypothetical protein ACPL_814 [Actinoplanes sp. SE50/110]ATO80112.1 hypothetical protein ACWT_0697 [Actinoplanes sp. SE50]SLL97516.1 hypothetical protein ACSP50_0723 [Actinoplanes sp. SE50/110]
MRYATPSRSAHRAAPAPDLMLLLRSFAWPPPRAAGPFRAAGSGRPAAGQHRTPARTRRHAWREPHPAHLMLARGLAALIVLGIIATLSFLIVSDDQQPGTDPDQALTSRAADPEPLTVAEAFPPGAAGYRVENTRAQSDCTLAVTGALRSALTAYGCSQAVRATLTVPDGDYRVTTGILNLVDAPGAAAVADQVRHLVETGDGSFTALTGTPVEPGTPVGWRARGHYLVYCAITGPGGVAATGQDRRLSEITAQLLDTYLSNQVLARRA